MSKINYQFGLDFSHLVKVATKIQTPNFSGTWSTVELQPDAFTPQCFTVGVVVQTLGKRLHFKLLSDYRKFECIYRNEFPQKSVREIMAYAEETLRLGVQEKSNISDIKFGTSCLSLSAPQYTSGTDEETTVERLFDEVVVMNGSLKKNRTEFESIDTPHARQLVNEELKRIADFDYELIVNQNNQGVLVEENGIKHFLDLNLITKNACGSVTSAVYKSYQSVELNLLKSSRDLTTCSRYKNLDYIGLFLLMPEPDLIAQKEYSRIESVIEEYEWKLEKDGFQVVSLSSPQDLAIEIYEWAKPTFS